MNMTVHGKTVNTPLFSAETHIFHIVSAKNRKFLLIFAAEIIKLQDKLTALRADTSTRSALHITLVTTYGTAHNQYWNTIQNELTMDDLF